MIHPLEFENQKLKIALKFQQKSCVDLIDQLALAHLEIAKLEAQISDGSSSIQQEQG